jgi:ribosome-binding factor A
MRRDDEGAGHRHLRVQGLVLEELRALLRDDVNDPALGEVRVVAVVLSVDYRHARVHFVLSGAVGAEVRSIDSKGESAGVPPARRPLERALERATPFLRARLADAIEMKRVPELRFVFDGVASPEDGGGAPWSG